MPCACPVRRPPPECNRSSAHSDDALPYDKVEADPNPSVPLALATAPVHNVSNGSYIPVPVEISLNGQLADLTASRIPFEYYGPEVLSVRWVYPVAGPKGGGTSVTVYGTGFKKLGLDIVSPVIDRDAGYSYGARSVKCIFGDLPMVEGRIIYAIGDERAKAALGDDPDLSTDDAPLASAVVCDTPPWTNRSSYYRRPDEALVDRCDANDPRSPREECELEEPRSVCVRVTLNDDPHAHSGEGGGVGDCARYTFFDE